MIRRAFTVTEFVATFVLALMVLGLSQAMLGCGGGGGGSRSSSEDNVAKARAGKIVQMMANFSPGNSDYYPGLRRGGNEDKSDMIPHTGQYGVKGKSGFDPAYRIAVLLRHNYIAPEDVLSPGDAAVTAASLKGTNPGEVTAKNFSFAVLELSSGKGRNAEWKVTTSSKAAVVSDRNLGQDADAGAKSVATSPWEGVVAFNDVHVMFEKSPVLANTKYGSQGPEVATDNLFKTDDDGKGADAMMTYKSPNDGGVNQNP